jgi:hypothetical protein
MLPRNRTPKSCKFITHRSLLIAGESPLSRSPSYSAKSWVNHPASNRTGYSLSYPVRNSVSYLDGYGAGDRASYSPENSASYWESCRDSNSAGRSASRPDNRWERNPESNRERNGADYSESYSADSSPDCLASYPESFDPRLATRPAQVQGPDRGPDWQLPQRHHRVSERGGNHGTGLSGQGSTRRRNRALPRAVVHRPGPSPTPCGVGLHPPRRKALARLRARAGAQIPSDTLESERCSGLFPVWPASARAASSCL